MSDIFEEVEESLARDDWTERWKKYGIFVYGAAAILIGTVAFLEWKSWNDSQITIERVMEFESAKDVLAQGQYEEAASQLEAVIDQDAPLAVIAGHELARTRLEGNGDRAAAAAALEKVASPEGTPLEKLALLKAAYLKADNLSLEEMEVFLGPLPSETSSLGNLAREIIAAKAFEAGDYQRARDDYGFLSISPDAPQGLARRASAALIAIPDTEGVAPLPSEEPETGEGPDQ